MTSLGNAATWQADGRIFHPTLNPTTNNNHPIAEYWGKAVNLKVLPFGQVGQTSLRGRIVAALADQREYTSSNWPNNEGRPYVVTSDDGGANWSTPALIGDQASPAINVSANSTVGPWPDVAYDPNDPANVYVVFRALAPNSSTNWDLYIAESENGGATFPNNLIVHLSDDDLGFDDGDEQKLPAIAVDECGGINLLFYTDAYDPSGSPRHWDAYHARLSGAGVVVSRLSAAAFPEATTPSLGVGHYVQIAAAGDYVYPCYIERRWVNGQWTKQELHVRQITVCE